jgi:inner membrane protein
VDSITHGLVAVLLSHTLCPGGPVLFAVLGAVLPDSDIFLKWISDRDPRLFIFTHGGFTHSILGTTVIATGIVLGFWAWLYSSDQGYAGVPMLVFALGFSWAGALTHIGLDALAFPGIPILYPVSSKKFSAGIFPGPSLVLFATSVGFLLMFLTGYIGISALSLYASFGMAFILAHVLMKAIVATHHRGLTIPTINPLKWLVIREFQDSYQVYSTSLLKRSMNVTVYQRYEGVEPSFLDRHSGDPEIRRLLYYSYFTISGREGREVVIRDPLREDGVLFYPPCYTRVRLPCEADEPS